MKQKFLIFIIFILAISLFARIVPPEKQARLDSIRSAIKLKGVNWTADTNAIFLMEDQDFELMLGEIGDHYMDTLPMIKPSENSLHRGMDEELPDSFSWKTHEGRNWMTSIKNQGGCGSCWAFASIGVWEAAINIALDSAEYDLNLSEQQLVSCARSYWDCDGGSWCGAYLMNNGVADEACYPYTATNGDCDLLCADWRDRVYFRSTMSSYVNGRDENIEQLKAMVLEQPGYVSFDVYQDFNGYSGGIYEHSWGSYRGGHGVVLMGFNDIDSCWICKNSWGSGWGEDGYFRIKYYDCDIARYSYRVRVASKIKINSEIAWTVPDTGYIFQNLDTTVFFLAHNPIMGNGDTIFRPAGALIDGFKGDSTIILDTFTLRIDGPIEITWQWDTIIGVSQIPLHIKANHQDAAFELAYMQMEFDTSITWIAESTLTIFTDSHQTLLPDSLRQIAISWESWSDGGDLSHSIILPESGDDSIKATFVIDTTRFWTVLESESWAPFLINGEEAYPTWEDFIDSGMTQEIIAQEYSGGAELHVFDHWIPFSEDDTLELIIHQPESLKAFYIKKKRTWFSNDFADGFVKIDGVNLAASECFAHDSGGFITLNPCEDQVFHGHFFEYEMWSDSISEEHTICLDTARYMPDHYIAYYDERSMVKAYSDYGLLSIDSLIAPVDSAITISVLDDTLYDEDIRHICSGWSANSIVYDTIFFEGFYTSGEGSIGGVTHPDEWIEDSIWNDWMTGTETVPFAFPQEGDAMMTVNLSHSEAGDTAWLVSDTFMVPDDADSVKLWFWMLEAYHPNAIDSLWVQVSSDSGDTWNLEGRYNNHGPKLDWQKRVVDLDGYAGENILLRFKAFAGGWSEYRIVYDDIFVWAAYHEIDSGATCDASFTPEWNCSLSYEWYDESKIEVISDHGTTDGDGWYKLDSLAVISATDSVEFDDYLFVFSGWQGLVDEIVNPHSFAISEPGTIWARYDTFVNARVLAEFDCAEVVVNVIDTADVWSDWLLKGDSIWIDIISPVPCGIDTQIYFRKWSDSISHAHYCKFNSPDSVKALFDLGFKCYLAKSPFTGEGWIAMDADTFTDSLSNWYMKGDGFNVAASDSDYAFSENKLWLFDGYSDGDTEDHYIGPIEQPMTIQANYSSEDFLLEISFETAADSIWSITDTLEYGGIVQMIDEEGFIISNSGNAPIDLGLKIVDYDHTEWLVDSIAGHCHFNIRGRFQTDIPLIFERHYDFVDTLQRWSDNEYLGSEGWAIYPNENSNLWLYFALPTSCVGYWGGASTYTIQLLLNSRYWMP